MEMLKVALDAAKFDEAVRGTPGKPVLPEGGDLAVYFRRAVTSEGRSGCVFTFTVQLPDGSLARAQAVATLRHIDMLAACVRGWRARGELEAEG